MYYSIDPSDKKYMRDILEHFINLLPYEKRNIISNDVIISEEDDDDPVITDGDKLTSMITKNKSFEKYLKSLMIYLKENNYRFQNKPSINFEIKADFKNDIICEIEGAKNCGYSITSKYNDTSNIELLDNFLKHCHENGSNKKEILETIFFFSRKNDTWYRILLKNNNYDAIRYLQYKIVNEK